MLYTEEETKKLLNLYERALVSFYEIRNGKAEKKTKEETRRQASLGLGAAIEFIEQTTPSFRNGLIKSTRALSVEYFRELIQDCDKND